MPYQESSVVTDPTPGIISNTSAVAVIIQAISPGCNELAPRPATKNLNMNEIKTHIIIDIKIVYPRISSSRTCAIVRDQRNRRILSGRGRILRHVDGVELLVRVVVQRTGCSGFRSVASVRSVMGPRRLRALGHEVVRYVDCES